jgi:iron complex transport system ATP-binding protein
MNFSSTEILTLNSLEIGYTSGKSRNVLLPPLTATAKAGELIAVIGRNGIGKSTLLRALAGLQPSLGGDIYVKGKNLREYPKLELAQEVGYISTEIVKVSKMTVYELVALGRFPHTNWIGAIDKENRKIIMDSLTKTNMSGYTNRFISELSDGERQRAMIARILAQDTGIMIMDEPLAFLDISSKYEILHLMQQLSLAESKTIIFSTHELNMAINQSDKIWLMNNRSLIEGAPEDLMIAGIFDNLFDSPSVKFNSDNGTFSFRSKELKSIYLEGEGIYRHWTEKAINRAGYSVSTLKSIPYIILPSGLNLKWQLVTNDSSFDFSTLYDLVKGLGNIT